MASSTGARAGGVASEHDERTDELRLVLEQYAHPIATIIVETAEQIARAIVRDELASIGGELLADYGSTSPATDVGLEDQVRIQDRALGTLGGRLVRLGDGRP